MAFGDAATLLTSFTGANESPLSDGGNWAKLNTSTADNIQRISNAFSCTGNTTGGVYWTPKQFGPDVEAYFTIATKPTATNDVMTIGLRIQGAGGAGTWDGYTFSFSTQTGTDTWAIERWTNALNTSLLSGSREYAAGERIGFSVIGDTLSGYVFTGGSWTLLGSVTDTTYTAEGSLAIRTKNNVGRGDDLFVARLLLGYSTIGGTGAGVSASISVETGVGIVGAVGVGAQEFSGAVTYVKAGYAAIGAVGAGMYSAVPGGTAFTKLGHGIVGATMASSSVKTIQPKGVSLGLGAGVLTAYPDWTRIDTGA